MLHEFMEPLGLSQNELADTIEVVPGLVEVEVAVPRLRPAVW